MSVTKNFIKNTIKHAYYWVNPIFLPPQYTFEIGYIFHTEEIFNPDIHKKLISFCSEYLEITGTKCICVTMTPPNMRVAKGMRLFGCSNREYINRMQELSSVAHIGFHGHFWHDPIKFEDADFDIRKNNTGYVYEVFYKQFSDQINWFYENNIVHNNTYSGGWWFINKDLIELLMQHDILYDYTMSRSPNLWNPYSTQIMNDAAIKYGESFVTSNAQHKLLHIQNLHSGHNTPYPMDATRFMNTLVDNEFKKVRGVVNSHDYNLDYDYTINWIKYLKKHEQVKFLDHHQLVNIEKSQLKEIVI